MILELLSELSFTIDVMVNLKLANTLISIIKLGAEADKCLRLNLTEKVRSDRLFLVPLV